MLAQIRHYVLLPTIALVGLVLAFFHKIAFTNLVLARGDTLLYFYPYWDVVTESVRGGHLPLWNPDIFAGVPLLANSQAGALYPINWAFAWLPTPTAINFSILIHIAWAVAGVYVLCRIYLDVDRAPAFIGGALFGLGGMVTAHVEQVNQLQGMAWMGWIFLLYFKTLDKPHAYGPFFSGALALQILTGHTQVVFMEGIALVLLMVIAMIRRRSIWRPPLWLGVGGFVAVMAALAQLLPTFELTTISHRSGGLSFNDAVSFSLPPAVLGQALLPAYGDPPFSEYVAWMGVGGMVLAFTGMIRLREKRRLIAFGVVAAVGLAFALGAYNPLYWLLARLPGFGYFRVPARWLVLYALGMSVLAAQGLQELRAQPRPRPLWTLVPPILLMAWAMLAGAFIEIDPLDAPPLNALTPAGWVIGLTASALLIVLGARDVWQKWLTAGWTGLIVLELFLAGQHLPYNAPTAPEALTSYRPSIAYLDAASRESLPPPRFLSRSHILFDPGDLGEIAAIFGPQIPEGAVYDYVLATKYKEVVAPNLSMIWNLPTLDGYDGGVLPINHYNTFARLLLPGGEIDPDGRLRERLPAFPDARWLNLSNTRYLLTDKLGDAWYDDIFYDLEFAQTTQIGREISAGHVPDFEATALGVVFEPPQGRTFGAGQVFARCTVTFADAAPATLMLSGEPPVARISWDQPYTAESVACMPFVSGVTIRGMSLIDGRTGAFESLTLGPYRLAYSGDVKIYENLDVLPRAFMVYNAALAPDNDAALAMMQAAAFDPAETVILHAPQLPLEPPNGENPAGSVRVLAYEPEVVRLEVTTSEPGYLVLSDAFYPGWTATVGGNFAPILRADVLFRAVPIPAGTHNVIFNFEPTLWPLAALISGIVWLGLLIAFMFRLMR